MDRVKGYYWVQVGYYQGWHIAYWNGVEWIFNGGCILDRHMDKITETPIPEPEEKEVNNEG
jgi:hypothetical protein